MKIFCILFTLLFLSTNFITQPMNSDDRMDTDTDTSLSDEHYSDFSGDDGLLFYQEIDRNNSANSMKSEIIEAFGGLIYSDHVFYPEQESGNKKNKKFHSLIDDLSSLNNDLLENESLSEKPLFEKFNQLIIFLEKQQKNHQLKMEITEKLNILISSILDKLEVQCLEVDPADQDNRAKFVITTIESILNLNSPIKQLVYLNRVTEQKRKNSKVFLGSLNTYILETLTRLLDEIKLKTTIPSSKTTSAEKNSITKKQNALEELAAIIQKLGRHEYFLQNKTHIINYLKTLSPLIKEEFFTRAMENKFDTFALWLVDAEASINANSSKGISFLAHAIESNQPTLVHFLLDHNAPVNEPDISGRTPLALATQKENKDALQKLLDQGADPNLKCTFGIFTSLSPLDIAVDAIPENTEITQLLVTRGALVYCYPIFRSPLVKAVIRKYAQSFQCMLTNLSSHYIEEVCDYIFNHPDCDKDILMLQLLFKQGSKDINFSRLLGKYVNGHTISGLQINVLKLLFFYGAHCNDQSIEGAAPLINLCEKLSIQQKKDYKIKFIKEIFQKQKSIAALFLDHNADRTLADDQGATAEITALKNNNRKLASFIKNYGIKLPSLKDFALRCIRKNKRYLKDQFDSLTPELEVEVQTKSINGIFYNIKKNAIKGRF